ncbi:iron-sulfur cluster biosynthesis family protein [Aquibacillus albus]|uniref:Uncharacterized protein YqkB n=1 Tax=Aquibacillus albus TaxID=1168171 RepID=A0ABS2MVE2_9BACI|nr:iron-sulfur cluster biosynthesis family protein [Aquibacillus albus]MBM7569753.1 uncharacterized protein YqkB [Aquibacillus albus]
MELSITAQAKEIINQWKEPHHHYLLLHYDTDDCGCGVSGLPTIRLVEKIDNTYYSVENDDFNVMIHHQQSIFFADKIKLHYKGNGFRLSSPEGILNPIISAHDLVKGDVS